MAIDIQKIILSNLIKNGTIVVSCKVTGPRESDLLDTYVLNTPDITDIESKYDHRFDDPSYYYGCSTDGGDV